MFLSKLLPDEAMALLAPETVTPGVIFLVAPDAPQGVILAAGAGAFARTRIYESDGICLEPEQLSAEAVAAQWADISAPNGQREFAFGGEQSIKFLAKAADLRGIEIPSRR